MLTQVRRRLWQGVTTALFAALLVAIPQPASAAESIPDLQWSAVQVSDYSFDVVTSPSGEVTTSCANPNNPVSNLRTYNSTGQLVREIPKTDTIDDVENCIEWPAVGEDGDVYGIPTGQRTNGSYGPGPNLLAYSGNTLKWKYPTGCSQGTSPTVGADGNIYFVGNGRLIGLTPDVEPPLTTPAKVLDVPAGINGCAEYLVAFKEGIAVVKDLRVKFYSYSGTNLSGPLGNAYASFGVDQISATGRFFYDTYLTSGGLRSAQISAYDYGRQEVMWTVTASGSGAYVYSANPYATPDGGTLVYLRQKETNEFGEWTGREAQEIVKLNAFGIKEWSKTLPLSDIDGNQYGATDIKVDTNGNIAVVRRAKLKTSEDRLADAVSIAVFGGNGDVVYTDTLHGNLDENVGYFTGYRLNYNLSMGPDTLHVTARQCSGTSCNGDTKFFPIEVPGLGLDYPRGVIVQDDSYVALGDSYSSGTGTFDYYPESGNCYRSSDSYVSYVADQLDLSTPLFAACHGAQTADFYNDNPNTGESAQISHLSEDTQVVTLTIGGNDAGFGHVMEACVNHPVNTGWGCSTDASLTSALTDRFNALAGTATVQAPDSRTITPLSQLYEDIATAAPNAEIYVGGYPRLFGSDIANYTANSSAPGGAQCNTPVLASISYSDAQWLNQKADELNGIIANAVVDAQNAGVDVTFVPATSFTSHGQCDSSSEWIHPVVFDSAWNPEPESLHPTTSGYANGYGVAFVTIMS